MAAPFKTLLWRCAGVTVPIIRQPGCETDHNKLAAIGATVLLTGVLAGLTGGYAFLKAFKSWEAAIALGCFWGLLIFNLDRFMVMSIRKKDVSSMRLPGRVKTKVLEVFASSPRFLLAVLLSLIITKPLELKLFEPEIDLEVQEIKREMEEAARKMAEQPPAAPGPDGKQPPADEMQALIADNNTLKQQETDAYKEWQKLDDLARREYDGEPGEAPGELSGRRGPGTRYGHRVEAALEAKKRYEKIVEDNKKAIERNDKQIESLSNAKATIENQARELRVATDGLAIRLAALSQLTSKDEREPYRAFNIYQLQGSVYRYANWGLIAIILLLELSPILFKIFSPYGAYDRAVEAEEAKSRLAKEQELFRLQTATDMLRESRDRKKKTMLDFQDTLLDNLLDDIPSVCADSKVMQGEMDELRRAAVRQAISMTRQSLADIDLPRGNGNGRK